MNTEKIISLTDQTKEIARQAGAKIMDIYQDVSNFDIETKENDSPLTRADKEANDIICDMLIKIAPEIPIISEENKETPYEIRKQYDYVWIVDPLDGTKEFIKRNGEFTVNIALVKKDTVIAGVVYAPVLDELYYATKNEGAFIEKAGETKRLSCKSFNSTDAELGIVCSRSHLNDLTQAFIDNYQEPVKVAKGSSLKFLILAAGEAHLYPRLAPTMEWDTAAAQIVLEESGGKVINAETGNPLRYNKEDLLNPHFIARANLVE